MGDEAEKWTPRFFICRMLFFTFFQNKLYFLGGFGACSKVVLHRIRIAEARVRFSPGPLIVQNYYSAFIKI